MITDHIVLSKTDHASLWNTIIIEVVGRFDMLYFLVRHLKYKRFITKYSGVIIHLTPHTLFRTSDKDLFTDMRSLASKLKRFIWNNCCINNRSFEGTTTGLPISPSPGIGS